MQRVTLSPLPYGYVTAVMIRDDDVSFFTPSYKLDQLYQGVLKQGFKVSLGIIPNVKAIDDFLIPPSSRGKMSQHEICDNEELVEYLREKIAANECDIVQHGYNHEMLSGVPEFSVNNASEIESRLGAGRGRIEACLGVRVSAFVPPWNRVSKQARKILGEHDLALCLGTRKNRLPQLGISPELHVGWSSNPVEIFSSVDPWSNRNQAFVFGRDLVDRAKRKFEECVKNGDCFCLLNHYWGYYQDWQDSISQEKLDSFYSILNYVDRDGVWKTTLSEMGSWLRGLRGVKLHQKGNMITLASSTLIRGVTIKAQRGSVFPANEANVIVKKEGDSTLLIFKEIAQGGSEVVFIK